MERSIESIWKKGFLETDALVVPKLNDLYNQKSKNIIDKFLRMTNINLKAIVIGSVVIFAIYYLLDLPLTGFFIFVMLNIMAFVSKKRMKKINDIDKTLSSYQYLRSFDQWIKDGIEANTVMMRILYPSFVLCAITAIWFAKINETTTLGQSIANNTDMYLILGIPINWLALILFILGLVAYFSKHIYMFDFNIVYGRILKKIEELIADMDELRSGY